MNFHHKPNKDLQQQIASLRQQVEVLQEIEARYRFMIEHQGEGIGIVDTDENFTFSNRAAEEIFGVPEGGLIGRNLSEFVQPEEFERLRRQTDLRRLGQTNRYEVELTQPEGGKRYIWITATPVRNRQDVFTGTLGIFFDMTDHKRAEDALRDSEDRLRIITDSAQDAILMMDSEGAISFWNPAAETIFGYRSEEVIGKNLHRMLVPGRYLEAHLRAFTIFRNTGKGDAIGKTLELTACRKDGTEFFVALSLSAVSFREQWHAVGILRDITEQKNTEKALKEALKKAETASKLKSAFIYNISHEVRTPLNGILGFSQLITEPDITPEEKEQFNTLLKGSAKRLINTITNYIDISMITSGNMEVIRKPAGLKPILEMLYTQFLPMCRIVSLSLHLDIQETTSPIILHTDPELLRKALTHLLDNAVKFSHEGGIRYGFTIKPGGVEVFVRDTGIGISPEAHERIFQNFVQEELSLTRGYEGSGLGLSIAQGIVRLLGGEIRVVSEKGEGSEFSFFLPFEEKSSRISVSAEQGDEVPLIENPVILIAEDDEPNLLFLQTILTKTGGSLLLASNGKEAVEHCRNHPEVSLVLMDLKMPVMDGYEATKEIKSFRKGLPVIAITAFAMTGDKKIALEAGCDDFIAKPVDREELRNKLETFGIRVVI